MPRFEGNNSRLASLILANTELVKIKEVATFVFVNLDTGENIAMKNVFWEMEQIIVVLKQLLKVDGNVNTGHQNPHMCRGTGYWKVIQNCCCPATTAATLIICMMMNHGATQLIQIKDMKIAVFQIVQLKMLQVHLMCNVLRNMEKIIKVLDQRL